MATRHRALWLFWAGMLGFLGVACGAFGAHVLRSRLDPRLFEAFQTAARYQVTHALALLGTALLSERFPGVACRVAGHAFVVGVLLFCGSLYALALTGVRALGAVTPLGGVALLVGWAALAVAGIRAHRGAEGSF